VIRFLRRGLGQTNRCFRPCCSRVGNPPFGEPVQCLLLTAKYLGDYPSILGDACSEPVCRGPFAKKGDP
jgi:hypothetical protein